MKNSPLTSILLGALVLSAIVSLIVCYLFFSRDHEIRALQAQIEAINNRQIAVNYLARDAVEYSAHNHAIDPILEAAGVKQHTGTPAPTTNTPKSSGK